MTKSIELLEERLVKSNLKTSFRLSGKQVVTNTAIESAKLD